MIANGSFDCMHFFYRRASNLGAEAERSYFCFHDEAETFLT